MGHLGLTPQSINVMGGYRVQGRVAADAKAILDDARRLQDAGCFAIVLEGIPAELAGRVTEALTIPTIGIGAGPHCSGQVLVLHDIVGLSRGAKPNSSATMSTDSSSGGFFGAMGGGCAQRRPSAEVLFAAEAGRNRAIEHGPRQIL
jgi:3-methyl-2-oxobutanoate hydroxymethyltransferase